MKIKLDREQFLEKIKKASKFVAAESVIPALANIKLTGASGMVEIIASDPQCQIKLFCPFKGDDFAVCLPADLLLKTLTLFRENEVNIAIAGNKVTLKNGKAKYNLTTDTEAADFPLMPVDKASDEVCIQQYYLKMGLKFSNKFIEDRSIAFGVEGLNMAEIGNRMIFTGLDGFTCSRVSVKPISIGKWSSNLIMPPETAVKVMSMLSDDGEVHINRTSSKVIFWADSNSPEKFEIISVFMNAKFPDSEKIFSYQGEDFMVINNLELRDSISRLKLYCSKLDKAKKVHIKTNPDNLNELILNAIDDDFGKSGEEIITIINNAGKPMLKHFNVDYLLKILHSIDTTDIQFFWHESDKVSCFIIPVEEKEENNNFKFLISSTSV